MVRRSCSLALISAAALSVALIGESCVGVRVVTSLQDLQQPHSSRRVARFRTRRRPVPPTTALGSLPSPACGVSGGCQRAGAIVCGSGATTPADPSIAAGASDVVEAVNSALFVYNRSGHADRERSRSTRSSRTPSGWAVQVPARGLRPGVGPVHPGGVAVQRGSLGMCQRSEPDPGRRRGRRSDRGMAVRQDFNNLAQLPDIGRAALTCPSPRTCSSA